MIVAVIVEIGKRIGVATAIGTGGTVGQPSERSSPAPAASRSAAASARRRARLSHWARCGSTAAVSWGSAWAASIVVGTAVGGGGGTASSFERTLSTPALSVARHREHRPDREVANREVHGAIGGGLLRADVDAASNTCRSRARVDLVPSPPPATLDHDSRASTASADVGSNTPSRRRVTRIANGNDSDRICIM